MLRKALHDIGFAEKEVAVYMALLELGPQPVSVIARKSNLNRSTTYVVLEGLLKRGVVSRFTRSDIQHFAATSPETLLDYIERSKRDLEKHHEIIKDLLPHIKSLANPYTSKPKVRYYEGIEGVKHVMDDTMNANGEILCYSALDKWLNGPLENYIKEYGKKRIFEKKLKLRGLVCDTVLAREYLASEYPGKLTKTKWLPKDLSIFDNEINIYNDKMAIVSISQEEMFGVIIESQAIADTQKQIFELAWRGAVAIE